MPPRVCHRVAVLHVLCSLATAMRGCVAGSTATQLPHHGGGSAGEAADAAYDVLLCADDEDKASSSESDLESLSDGDSSDEEEGDSVGAQRRLLAPAAANPGLWPHMPIGMRPISAGASRKRPASSTPGSDQVLLQ